LFRALWWMHARTSIYGREGRLLREVWRGDQAKGEPNLGTLCTQPWTHGGNGLPGRKGCHRKSHKPKGSQNAAYGSKVARALSIRLKKGGNGMRPSERGEGRREGGTSANEGRALTQVFAEGIQSPTIGGGGGAPHNFSNGRWSKG